MKITAIEFLPLQLTMGLPGSPLGTDSSTKEQKDASAEVLAAQRYAPPETVLSRHVDAPGAMPCQHHVRHMMPPPYHMGEGSERRR